MTHEELGFYITRLIEAPLQSSEINSDKQRSGSTQTIVVACLGVCKKCEAESGMHEREWPRVGQSFVISCDRHSLNCSLPCSDVKGCI